MSIANKKARFYKVSKRNGKLETWTYFVPGQNVDSVKLEADEENNDTEVSAYDWFEVSVLLDQDGVYFSAFIDGDDRTFYEGEQGYAYLKEYLKPAYDEAYRAYNS